MIKSTILTIGKKKISKYFPIEMEMCARRINNSHHGRLQLTSISVLFYCGKRIYLVIHQV